MEPMPDPVQLQSRLKLFVTQQRAEAIKLREEGEAPRPTVTRCQASGSAEMPKSTVGKRRRGPRPRRRPSPCGRNPSEHRSHQHQTGTR